MYRPPYHLRPRNDAIFPQTLTQYAVFPPKRKTWSSAMPIYWRNLTYPTPTISKKYVRITRNENLMVSLELDIFKSILAWANLSQFNGDNADTKPEENIEKTKHEEVKGLLLNVRVVHMESWEIEMAWRFGLVRNCPKTVDSITKRLLSVNAKRADEFGVKPLRCAPILEHQLPWPNNRFTFLFKIAKKDTTSGSWDCSDNRFAVGDDSNTGWMWKFRIYSRGNLESDRKHISPFLWLNSKSTALNS